MLVIISDLHLTDGTSGEIIDEKAFRIFRNRVSDMAYDASWRIGKDPSDKKTGSYQPLERLDILLLGDILDMIRSEQWNNQPEMNMPWTKDRGDAFFAQLESIIDGVLENNKKSFSILKDIATNGIKIPSSMRLLSEVEKLNLKIGSAASEEKSVVKVNIYYMVGNHDWFLYIDDPRMNAMRNRIIDALGLANERDKRFPHFPNENNDLDQIQSDHNVYALHGDIFDITNCQSTGRDASSVGDVVVLKLLNEIPRQIEKLLTTYSPDQIGTITDTNAFIKELREIDNLRPYSLAPHWISYVISKYQLNAAFVNESIRGALRQLIHDFTKNPLVSPHHLTVIEMGIGGLLLRSHLTIEDLASLIENLSLSKDSFESYRKYARTLITGEPGKGKTFFVMGHTHYPEIVPMSSFIKNGQQVSQLYINTGTWRPLHKEGIYDDSFISYQTMTMAGFFKGNERMGHTFEYWTGSLDI
jgi:UDP-2,3-diacylglucosamine pyrophosphatase LpxH